MKKHFLILVLFFATIYTTTQAKIWRVNNTPGVQADFSDGQVAVNTAVSGDTIYFEPSLFNYGNLNFSNKTLNIFTNSSVGRNFGFDTVSNLFATINYLFMDNADKSIISIRYSDKILINNSDSAQIIQSAYIGNLSYASRDRLEIVNSSNIFVRKSRLCNVKVTNSSDVIIANNILSAGISVDQNAFATVSNNTLFTNQYTGGGIEDDIYNSSVFYNIYVHQTNTYFHNSSVFYNTEINPSVNSNLGPNLSAVGWVPGSPLYLFNNSSTSFLSAFGSATGSYTYANDIIWINSAVLVLWQYGAYAGGNPYKQGTPPPIPAITNLQIPTTNTGASMNVIFSATSNK